MAGNDHGLLLWRTSNLGNVRRPSGVTYYFKTPRGRAEAMAASRMLCVVLGQFNLRHPIIQVNIKCWHVSLPLWKGEAQAYFQCYLSLSMLQQFRIYHRK